MSRSDTIIAENSVQASSRVRRGMVGEVVPEVFIVGSGCSLGQITQEEKEYINRAECVIALNKYMAFYNLVDIVPTHVMFIDTGGTRPMIQRIFDVCIRDNLQGITFILHRTLRWRISAPPIEQHIRVAISKLTGRAYEPNLFRVPSNCNFEYTYIDFAPVEDIWATSLDQPLYHHRGSLTIALNYAAIKYPNHLIKLIGVDLNSPQYFYQSELEKLEFEWRDFTTPIVEEKGVHFSTVQYQGTTIFDRFDYVVEMLARTNNKVVNCNPDSLLVTKGFTPYSPVIT